MRGKVDIQTEDGTPDRITPAYAGKSHWTNVQRLLKQDHPRLCGEKVKTNGKSATEKGSPPPMRGKVRRFRKTGKVSGITPAYAGKSLQLHNLHM